MSLTLLCASLHQSLGKPVSLPALFLTKVPLWNLFALFSTLALHIAAGSYGSLAWSLLILQFVLYLPLLKWHLARAPDRAKTEWQHRLLDAAMAGIWVAALSFPLWITYLLVGIAVFNMTSRWGLKGLHQAILAIGIGISIAAAINGLQWVPDTDLPTSASAMLSAILLMLTSAHTAHRHKVSLDGALSKLREAEQTQHDHDSEIALLQTKLNEQVNLDALTGLYNRRFLGPTLERELARCQRERQPLTLIMMDIDHLSRANVQFGRRAGDDLLRSLAAMLKERSRAGDVACRYGGEEVLLVLPNMRSDIAMQIAEGWRAAFAARPVYAATLPVHATVSVGVTTYAGLGESSGELVHRAELALLRAKSDGRDRVVFFGADFTALASHPRAG